MAINKTTQYTVNPESLIFDGSGVIYRNTIAEMLSLDTTSLVDQQVIIVNRDQDIQGGEFVWDAASTDADDGGIVFEVSGIATGRFKRVLVNEINANWYGLPKAGESFAEAAAIEAACFSKGIGAYFPSGTYDMGDNWFPFRNTVNTSLKDYGGIVVRGDGEETVISTTSSAGKDVFQVNATKGLTVRDLKITATLTAFNDAGSNGVSITNGGEDLHFEGVVCEDLPYVDQTTFLDGGKAFTIQPGSSTNPLQNITGRIVAKNVGYGFGMDIVNEARIDNPIKGIDVNIFVDTAYRGVVLSGSSPTSTVNSQGLDWGTSVKATTVNCQQHYTSSRAWHVSSEIHVINTLAASNLAGYLASDTEVKITDIRGAKNESVSVSGSVLDVDVLHTIGGTSYGGGVAGTTENCDIHLNVDYQVASTQFSYADSSGNRASKTNLMLRHITSAPFDQMVADSNTLTIGGGVRSRDPRFYNTFELRTDAGLKRFGLRSDGQIESQLTTTSAIGSFVGKKAEYDENGAFQGYRPLYT